MDELIFYGGWLAICAFLSFKIPRWLGIRRLAWPVTVILLPVLFAGPIYDGVLGMRQFKKLCAERAVISMSPTAGQVARAKVSYLPMRELTGYWIPIRSQAVTYTDIDTGQPFLWFEGLHTQGGRIGRIALMGSTHSCWPQNRDEVFIKFDLKRLLEKGERDE